MKKIAHIGSWLLILCFSSLFLSAHDSSHIRPLSSSASKSSDAASLVQAIHFQDSQLAIRLQTSEETEVQIYNVLGQLIAKRTLLQDTQEQEAIIPMQRFQEGTYLIVVRSPEQVQSYSLNTATKAVLP